MATLSGQRTQFTWALNEYNKTDDPEQRSRFVRHMATAIRNALGAGFTKDQITREKSYPAEDVDKAFADTAPSSDDVFVTEAQATESTRNSVDSEGVRRAGFGDGVVYAYGYRCAPDRLKIGCTVGDTIERIAAQIGTSTPDKPVLYLEFRTSKCRALERAVHAILDYRGKKIRGGGDEWFLTTIDDVEGLIDLIEKSELPS
jgi:hypothetical protein